MQQYKELQVESRNFMANVISITALTYETRVSQYNLGFRVYCNFEILILANANSILKLSS
jgi:hypothetical protein